MFATNMRISPVTNTRMPNTDLVKDDALLAKIEAWVEAKVDEEEFHDAANRDGQGGADQVCATPFLRHQTVANHRDRGRDKVRDKVRDEMRDSLRGWMRGQV